MLTRLAVLWVLWHRQTSLFYRAEGALACFAAERLVRASTVAASLAMECLDVPSQYVA